MEITIKIDRRNKQAKAVLEMLKTFDFVKFVNNEEQKNPSANKKIGKEQFIEDISKKVNKGVAEKWYKKSGITY